MQQVLTELLAGNAAHSSQFDSRFDDLQHSQRPDAVTVCCADARVLQDHLWDNDVPGRLFTCSNIGNRVVQRTDDGVVVSGDVLYPIVHTETDLAIVVGHTGCGAVTAAYDDLTDGRVEPSGISHCLDLLKPTLEPGVDALPPDVDRTEAVNRLVEYNVDRQIGHLEGSSDIPSTVTTVGIVYDFQDVYGGRRGAAYVVNVDGETDVDALRAANPAIADRIDRRWER